VRNKLSIKSFERSIEKLVKFGWEGLVCGVIERFVHASDCCDCSWHVHVVFFFFYYYYVVVVFFFMVFFFMVFVQEVIVVENRRRHITMLRQQNLL